MSVDSKDSGDRRYLIQHPDAVSFITSHADSKEQVIMGVPGPLLLAAFFDSEGQLLRHEVRTISVGSMSPGQEHPRKVRGELQKKLWDALETWKAEIHFTPSTVHVLPFYLAEYDVGINELPHHLRDYLEAPSGETDEIDRQAFEEEIAEWRSLGKFEFCWGNDYWLDSSGVVTDT